MTKLLLETLHDPTRTFLFSMPDEVTREALTKILREKDKEKSFEKLVDLSVTMRVIGATEQLKAERVADLRVQNGCLIERLL